MFDKLAWNNYQQYDFPCHSFPDVHNEIMRFNTHSVAHVTALHFAVITVWSMAYQHLGPQYYGVLTVPSSAIIAFGGVMLPLVALIRKGSRLAVFAAIVLHAMAAWAVWRSHGLWLSQAVGGVITPTLFVYLIWRLKRHLPVVS
jgi:hypothetical protein